MGLKNLISELFFNFQEHKAIFSTKHKLNSKHPIALIEVMYIILRDVRLIAVSEELLPHLPIGPESAVET
jgi:hypothetical protein